MSILVIFTYYKTFNNISDLFQYLFKATLYILHIVSRKLRNQLTTSEVLLYVIMVRGRPKAKPAKRGGYQKRFETLLRRI